MSEDYLDYITCKKCIKRTCKLSEVNRDTHIYTDKFSGVVANTGQQLIKSSVQLKAAKLSRSISQASCFPNKLLRNPKLYIKLIYFINSIVSFYVILKSLHRFFLTFRLKVYIVIYELRIRKTKENFRI